MDEVVYEHYIGVNWSMKNMAIARMTNKSNNITAIDVPSNIKELVVYLKNLRGNKILTIEETTTAQWLYAELKDYVDKIIICDPYRNKLLIERPKTDKIDARELVQLLKAGLVKEVYHSGEQFLYLRRLVSGYEDLVKSGVRLKNQRSALLRGNGKESSGKDIKLVNEGDQICRLPQQIQVFLFKDNIFFQTFQRKIKGILKSVTLQRKG